MNTTQHSSPLLNWPLSPLAINTIKLDYARVLDTRTAKKQCVLGDPQFADHLYNWLHDTHEELQLQVTLFRNQATDFLRTSMSFQVESDRQQYTEDWHQDFATAMAIFDPNSHWVRVGEKETNMIPKPSWKNALLLELDGQTEEDDNPIRLLETLFAVLNKIDIPLVIQSSFALEWKNPKLMKRTKSQSVGFYHFRPFDDWQRQQKLRQMFNNSRKRIIRRRIIIFSDQMISSLIRQSVFRGLIGTTIASAKWIKLGTKERTLALESPSKAMQFPIPKSDTIPKWEMQAMLTANLAKARSNQPQQAHPQDGIPF